MVNWASVRLSWTVEEPEDSMHLGDNYHWKDSVNPQQHRAEMLRAFRVDWWWWDLGGYWRRVKTQVDTQKQLGVSPGIDRQWTRFVVGRERGLSQPGKADLMVWSWKSQGGPGIERQDPPLASHSTDAEVHTCTFTPEASYLLNTCACVWTAEGPWESELY